MSNITVIAKYLNITGHDHRGVTVELELNERELDSVEIAESVSCETFFEAHSEDEILSYVKANYDWFNDQQTA